jgi:hypothetical protein
VLGLECQERGVKFVPLCKQRYVAEEQEAEAEECSGESDTEEMFDMMAMEEHIGEIEAEDGHPVSDENNNGRAKASPPKKNKASVLAEQERLAEESAASEGELPQKPAFKRSLDAKVRATAIDKNPLKQLSQTK